MIVNSNGPATTALIPCKGRGVAIAPYCYAMSAPITSPQARIQRLCLAEIAAKDPSSVSELALRVGSLRPTVSRAVNELQRRGLVARDARRLVLTPAGLRELEAVRDDVRVRLYEAQRTARRTQALATAVRGQENSEIRRK